jgi:hypothetical protein
VYIEDFLVLTMVFTPVDAVGCLSVAAVGEIMVDLFAGRRSVKSGESSPQPNRAAQVRRVSFSDAVEMHSARETPRPPEPPTKRGPLSLFGGYSTAADEEAKASLTSNMQSTLSGFGHTLSVGATKVSVGASDVKQKVQADLSKMKDACSDATSKVKDATSKATDACRVTCSDATSKVKDACSDATGKVKVACSDAKGKVKGACSDVMERSKSWSSLPTVTPEKGAEKRSWSWSSLPLVPPPPQQPQPQQIDIPSEMTQTEQFFIGDNVKPNDGPKDPEQGKEDKGKSTAAPSATACYDAFRQKVRIPPCIDDPEDAPIRRGSMLFDLDDEEPNCSKVRAAFNIACDAGFGEEVRVVGNVKALGEWDPSEAVSMKWTDGNVWVAELGVRVPAGEPLEYKYLIMADGEVKSWEICLNRIILEPHNGSSICFRDVWGIV